MPPPMEVMVPSTTEGMTVRPAERLLRRADDGPQGYRDVVQEVDDGVQVGGQLAEVEHRHAGQGAGKEKPRALKAYRP